MQTTLPQSEAMEAAQRFQQMMQMATGFWVSQCLYVAAKLGVADALQNGPKSVDALSKTLNANPDFLYRVMRALASLGVFEETECKMFRNNPLSEMLASDAPNSMRYMTIMMGEEHYGAWGSLKDAVVTGNSPFETVYGQPFFEYCKAHPESGDIFNGAMTELSGRFHEKVLSLYDFSGFKTIVDVGGGHGRLLSAILKQYPEAKGKLFDLPHVVAGADAILTEAGVSDRCEVHGGDFFKEVVGGGDAYVMGHIIHDWRDDYSLTILKNIHKAMNPGGKVLLFEQVVPEGNEGAQAKLMDLNMLVMTQGGRERTEAEYRDLLAKAGFRLERVMFAPSGHSVVEAVQA